jgi:hypothetical protein
VDGVQIGTQLVRRLAGHAPKLGGRGIRIGHSNRSLLGVTRPM